MSYEPRLRELERKQMLMDSELSRAQQVIIELNQMMPRAFMSAGGNSADARTNALWVMTPGGGVAAATGTWPNLVPSTFTADVYRKLGASSELFASGATIRWPYKDSDPGNRLAPVIQNDDSTFDALVDSCTRVDV